MEMRATSGCMTNDLTERDNCYVGLPTTRRASFCCGRHYPANPLGVNGHHPLYPRALTLATTHCEAFSPICASTSRLEHTCNRASHLFQAGNLLSLGAFLGRHRRPHKS